MKITDKQTFLGYEPDQRKRLLACKAYEISYILETMNLNEFFKLDGKIHNCISLYAGSFRHLVVEQSRKFDLSPEIAKENFYQLFVSNSTECWNMLRNLN